MTTEDEPASTPTPTLKQQWASILARWRSWIEHDSQRGARAELKRCAQVGSVLCQPAALRLHSQLQEHPWRSHAESVGVIAGIAPWLKRLPENKSSSKESELPLILGQPAKGDSPRFSELRFKRLLESRDSDELLQQLRRALAQTDGAGDWLHLADTITQSHRQWENPDQYTLSLIHI